MKRALFTVIAATLLAGCGQVSDQALNASLGALSVRAATTTSSTAPVPTPRPCDPTASLRPAGSLPARDAMPAGTYMAQIQRRGKLIVGVDQNTYLFAYFNPLHGRLEGFEIDLRARSSAIPARSNSGRSRRRSGSQRSRTGASTSSSTR
jgi:polar amino acid transport system substrate-binding protein